MDQIMVFGGPERRRRWHEDERAKILSEAFSGACVARVARQHDVSTALIYTWRRKACQVSGVAGSSTAAQVGFVEAVVLDDGGSKQAPSPPAVVVDLAGGRRVKYLRIGAARCGCRCSEGADPMIPVPSGGEVRLALGHTDMRKGMR